MSLNDQRTEDPSLSAPLRTIRSPSAPPSTVMRRPYSGAMKTTRHVLAFGSKKRTDVPILRSPLPSFG